MKCEFCKATFKQQIRLDKHLCEQKKRHLSKDSKSSKAAFMMWTKFKDHHRVKSKGDINSFLKHKQYKSFIGFQKWLELIQPVHQEKYFQYLLDNSIAFKQWTNESFYMQWMKKWVMYESPDQAVERTLIHLMHWCTEEKINLQVYDSRLSPNRLALWLRSGRVSPWFIFLSKKALDLLGNIPEDELARLEDIINPSYWSIRMKKFPEIKTLKKQLQDAGL